MIENNLKEKQPLPDGSTLIGPEEIIKRLKISGWIFLALLVPGSLFWRSGMFTAGILLGGLISNLGFRHLYKFSFNILKASTAPGPTFKSAFFFSYLVRLGVLAVAIFLPIYFRLVNPVGLVIGLSITIINLTTYGLFLFSRAAKIENELQKAETESNNNNVEVLNNREK